MAKHEPYRIGVILERRWTGTNHTRQPIVKARFEAGTLKWLIVLDTCWSCMCCRSSRMVAACSEFILCCGKWWCGGRKERVWLVMWCHRNCENPGCMNGFLACALICALHASLLFDITGIMMDQSHATSNDSLHHKLRFREISIALFFSRVVIARHAYFRRTFLVVISLSSESRFRLYGYMSLRIRQTIW